MFPKLLKDKSLDIKSIVVLHHSPLNNAQTIHRPFIIEKGGKWSIEPDEIQFIKSTPGSGKGELIQSLIK